jgi:hypothetical protein
LTGTCLREDVELGKLGRLLLVAKRIALWRFGEELSARIFIEYLGTVYG